MIEPADVCDVRRYSFLGLSIQYTSSVPIKKMDLIDLENNCIKKQ